MIRKLGEVLDLTIETWEEFNSSQGDVGYFSNLSSPIGEDIQNKCFQSLLLIHKSHGRLKCIRMRLSLQRDLLESLKNDVSEGILLGFRKTADHIRRS